LRAGALPTNDCGYPEHYLYQRDAFFISMDAFVQDATPRIINGARAGASKIAASRVVSALFYLQPGTAPMAATERNNN
jgi:hypothetical protein